MVWYAVYDTVRYRYTFSLGPWIHSFSLGDGAILAVQYTIRVKVLLFGAPELDMIIRGH